MAIDFKQCLQTYRSRIDCYLNTILQDNEQSCLLDAMHYSTLLGGKRLRPYLVYATGAMFDVPLSDLDTPAAAVECIHAYSLVHDDLPAMDNDEFRRGQATCHVKFGEATAILAGDSLLTLAFSLLSDKNRTKANSEQRLNMISQLAYASGYLGMCSGQMRDLASAGTSITLSTLDNIHQQKTGMLIRASVRLGAIAAGEKSVPFLSSLDQYAQSIGLAFQIQDDILDVIGDYAKIGKKPGSDVSAGKNTYPALIGLEQAQLKAANTYQQALAALTTIKPYYDTSALEKLAHFVIKRDN